MALRQDGTILLPIKDKRPKHHAQLPKHNGLQPHSIDAEEAVLGGILIDQDAYLQVSDFLNPNDFFLQRNTWVYVAMSNLVRQHKPIDLLSVTNELDRLGYLDDIGGPARLTDLINATPTSAHTAHYGAIVARKSFLRRAIEGATQIAAVAYDDSAETLADIVVQIEDVMSQVLNSRADADRFNRSSQQVMDDLYAYLSEPAAARSGIYTGIKDYDKKTGGYQRGTLNIVAARPKMGKTSLAMQVAIKAATDGKRVTFFSLDGSAQSLGMRMVSHLTGVDLPKIRDRKMSDQEEYLVTTAMGKIATLPIQIVDIPAYQLTPASLKSIVLRQEMNGKAPDLVVVDYLQLMTDPTFRGKGGDSRNHEIGSISGELKGLARQLDIPVIALSQLNRSVEGRSNKRPMDSDLRDSGSIEQDADTITFIYRDEVYDPDTRFPNLAEIILSKQKDGPTGTVTAYFKKEKFEFIDLETKTVPADWGNE